MICTILTWRSQFEMPRNGDWINARLLGVATAATLRLVSYGCFLEPRSSCFCCCFRQDVSISCSSQQINPAMCCSKDSQVGTYSSHVIRNTCGKGVRETWRHSFFGPIAASTCNIWKGFNHIGVEMFQADQVFLLADGTLCTDAGSHIMRVHAINVWHGIFGQHINMKTLGRFLHQWFLFTKCFHLFRWCGINMVCIHWRSSSTTRQVQEHAACASLTPWSSYRARYGKLCELCITWPHRHILLDLHRYSRLFRRSSLLKSEKYCNLKQNKEHHGIRFMSDSKAE